MLIIKCICSYGDCEETVQLIKGDIVKQLECNGWSIEGDEHYCEEHTEAIKQAGEPE